MEECHRVSYHWRSEMGLASDTQVPQNLRESPLPWASWMAVIGNNKTETKLIGEGRMFLFREDIGWGFRVGSCCI